MFVSQISHRPANRVVTREELLGRARALVPKLRERAPLAEALRHLPDETARDFHDAGLFRMLQPARVGGGELDYGMFVDVGAEIARGCASSSWILTNLASHHWMLAMWPAAAQHEVWDRSPDVLIASSIVFPAGRAARVEGGYTLSGHWPFSSGVENSDWNMLGAIVADDDPEAAEYRIFLVPKTDYEIIDTWHAAGLRGSGSNDVRTTDIFVPAHRTLAVADTRGGPTPGAALNPAPVFQIPVLAMFPYILAGVALGTALGAWEDFVGAMKSRVANYTGVKVGDYQTTQIKIADARARIDAAALIMRQRCAEAMRLAEAGTVPDIATKVAWRRDGAFSVGLCTAAVDGLFGASGGGGIYDRNPIQRSFRDAHAIKAHIAFNFEAVGATYGRVALGLSADNPTL